MSSGGVSGEVYKLDQPLDPLCAPQRVGRTYNPVVGQPTPPLMTQMRHVFAPVVSSWPPPNHGYLQDGGRAQKAPDGGRREERRGRDGPHHVCSNPSHWYPSLIAWVGYCQYRINTGQRSLQISGRRRRIGPNCRGF